MVRTELDHLLQENLPYGLMPESSRVSAFVTEWERTGHGAKACNSRTTGFMIDRHSSKLSLVRAHWHIARLGCEMAERQRKQLQRGLDNETSG